MTLRLTGSRPLRPCGRLAFAGLCLLHSQPRLCAAGLLQPGPTSPGLGTCSTCPQRVAKNRYAAEHDVQPWVPGQNAKQGPSPCPNHLARDPHEGVEEPLELHLEHGLLVGVVLRTPQTSRPCSRWSSRGSSDRKST